MNNRSGFVYIVGAGPGDPELLTVKALNAIQNAEVILYDALLDKRFLEKFPAGCYTRYVGKRMNKHSHTQGEINKLLVHYARQGFRVVRLKGGDPFIFGRGGEEVQALIEEKIPFEIIPGVSSLQAAGAEFMIPLTHRGISDRMLIINGHGISANPETDWKSISSFEGTIVIFMGICIIQDIASNLIKHGMNPETPIAIMENVSLPDSAITKKTLYDIAIEGYRALTDGAGIAYIGDVVGMFSIEELSAPQIADRHLNFK